jgi:signal peptidase I
VSAPQDGQVAVFRPPPQVPELGDTDFIKRVIAAPGDTLRIHDGVVYRNGKAVAEPYIMQKPDYELELKDYDLVVDGIPLDPTRSVVPAKREWQAPDRVPNGYYVMLGDNRRNSDDSHLWGFLRQDQFVGHAFLVFWPITRAKVLH